MSQDPFEFIRRQQEQYRKMLNSPVLEQIRRNEERIAKLTSSPVLEDIRRNEERIAKLTSSPVLEQIRRNEERIAKLTSSPVLDDVRRRNERIAQMISSPVLDEVRRNADRIAQLQGAPLDRFQRQFDQLSEILSAPIFDAVDAQRDRFEEALTPAVLDELVEYQDDLATRVAEYAADVTVEEVASSDSVEMDAAVWFGARSWQYLLWELNGLLKALELAVASLGGAKALLDAPIPIELLALAAVLVVAAELALYVAKGPPADSDRS